MPGSTNLCVGFWKYELPPSSKSHEYVRLFAGPSGSVPCALKATLEPAGSVVTLAEASTVGGSTPGARTVTVTSCEVLSPSSSVAVTLPVYVPGWVNVRSATRPKKSPLANSHL